jgi:hypothetical protein
MTFCVLRAVLFTPLVVASNSYCVKNKHRTWLIGAESSGKAPRHSGALKLPEWARRLLRLFPLAGPLGAGALSSAAANSSGVRVSAAPLMLFVPARIAVPGFEAAVALVSPLTSLHLEEGGVPTALIDLDAGLGTGRIVSAPSRCSGCHWSRRRQS